MAIKVSLLPSKPIQLIPNFPTNPFLSFYSSTHFSNQSRKHPIAVSCTNNNSSSNKSFSDSELALKLAAEVEKLNAQTVQREEAINKSRELLFTEFSNYMGWKAEEVKDRWRAMNEDDKLAVAQGFVSGWSDNFHPLSAKSTKELIEEYLADERESSSSNSGPVFFPSLKRLIGF
ncbi:OLC1v1002788C1 [Oldenlandia corymbosa var. corymbosa]|uniref:OLC1v1002788C1 n=1 Tax=Oldenlandia corymbosa var. corymbosa TaxID=529605 RepID=A0AAV1DBF1_OLDCO|nr:OLC1v1002788C1 [Oldenlandia corymbosa var. corymbosa]